MRRADASLLIETDEATAYGPKTGSARNSVTAALKSRDNELTMPRVLDPFRFVLIAVAGWMNQHQLQIIDYLREENRVLREQLAGRRVRFNDDQRRRLAVKAKGLGRRPLAEVATIVSPETLLAWHRKLIANKYNGTAQRGPGRPRTAPRYREVGGSTRRGEPGLGLSADPGRIVQSGARNCAQHDR